MNPLNEITKRYPAADFSAYFRFLEAARAEKGTDTQEHHICPRKQFPDFEHSLENLISLAVEDHVRAHRLLALVHPDFKRTASAAFISAAAVAGRKGGHSITPEQRQRAARAGGRKNVENGGISRLNSDSAHQAAAGRAGMQVVLTIPGHQAKAGRAGGKSRSENKLAACRLNGFQKRVPSSLGERLSAGSIK